VLGRKTHWIFDLDGTLTVAAHDFVAIRNELGIPPDRDILGFIDEQDVTLASQLSEKLNDIEQDIARKSVSAPGVKPLLNHLLERDCTLGIVTRNSSLSAFTSLEVPGLEGYFSAVIGREQASPKPDPEGIEQLRSRWSTSVDSMVMVGDYIHDLRAGRNAGVSTVYIQGQRAEDWDEYWDYRADDMGQLLMMLK
jgi:HAD superfamily hydrolase (TIGR01509 family)